MVLTLLARSGFKHLDDKDQWMVAEDIPDMDLFFSQIWLKSFVNNLHSSCGLNYKRVLSVYRGYHQQFYYGQDDCHKFALNLLAKLKTDPAWGDLVNEKIVVLSDALVDHAKRVHALDLKKKTNQELWSYYLEHVELHTRLYEYGWLPNAVDMFYPELTNYLKAVLRGKAKDESQVNTWFVALTSSEKETVSSREHKDLIKLGLEIRNDGAFRHLFEKGAAHACKHTPVDWLEKIARVHDKYKHLKFMYHGEVGRMEDVYFALEPLLENTRDLANELRELEMRPFKLRKEKQNLLDTLNLTKNQVHLFNVFADFMYTKWHRRNAQILALYYLESLLQEIALRIGVSLENVRTMLSSEVEDALQKGKFDGTKISARFKYYAYYVEEGKQAIFLGKEAEELEKRARTLKIDSSVKEILGQTACLGKARGVVKIIHRPADIPKMNKGDVLVAIATDPDIVPAMKLACAIVTEQGGVTSHAAIVSRELGIPCVIGTKIATKWLKDGDMVEVDATKGIVRKLP